MKYIIGRKIGMRSVFDVNGNVVAMTVIQWEPNLVLESNNKRIKVGYDQVDEKKLNKPELGYFKKLGVKPYRNIVEFDGVTNEYKKGDLIKVDTFTIGELVDIQGLTRGHGFTGAIKRWNYKIGPKSHGAGFPHRYQGSIAFGRGGSQGQRVPKGKKMSGHYGHETVTTEKLVVYEPVLKWNIILIQGAIPCPNNQMLIIKSSVKKPNVKKDVKIISKEIKEDILQENKQLEDKEALHEANLAAEAAEKKAEEKAAQEHIAKEAADKKEQEAIDKANEEKAKADKAAELAKKEAEGEAK